MTAYATYAPEYRLRINDANVPGPVRASITSVQYQDGVNAADRVEIGLANPNLRWLQNHIRGLGFQPFPTAIGIDPVGQASCRPGRLVRHRQHR